MKVKTLEWKSRSKYPFVEEYISDISIKGLFGIRFVCQSDRHGNFLYKYVINGSWHGGYKGFQCASFEDGKEKCQTVFADICSRISQEIFYE